MEYLEKMRIFKLCPSGRRHLWFRRYCYHKSTRGRQTHFDGVISSWRYNAWDFRKQRYRDKMIHADDGPHM